MQYSVLGWLAGWIPLISICESLVSGQMIFPGNMVETVSDGARCSSETSSALQDGDCSDVLGEAGKTGLADSSPAMPENRGRRKYRWLEACVLADPLFDRYDDHDEDGCSEDDEDEADEGTCAHLSSVAEFCDSKVRSGRLISPEVSVVAARTFVPVHD